LILSPVNIAKYRPVDSIYFSLERSTAFRLVLAIAPFAALDQVEDAQQALLEAIRTLPKPLLKYIFHVFFYYAPV
jgi:hypothetical protein